MLRAPRLPGPPEAPVAVLHVAESLRDSSSRLTGNPGRRLLPCRLISIIPGLSKPSGCPFTGDATVAIRVAINGFGRIGRLTYRIMAARGNQFEVVAVNDLTDNKTLATLLKYDSIHRRYDADIAHDDKHLIVNGKKIHAFEVRSPAELPWKELGIDVVVESSGVFTGRGSDAKPGYGSHLTAGAKKVVLSAPAKDDPDLTVVLGVNDDQLKPEMKCISNASCTTNCLAPVAKVLHERLALRKA